MSPTPTDSEMLVTARPSSERSQEAEAAVRVERSSVSPRTKRRSELAPPPARLDAAHSRCEVRIVRSTSASHPGRSLRQPANCTRPARRRSTPSGPTPSRSRSTHTETTTTTAPRREHRRLRRRPYRHLRGFSLFRETAASAAPATRAAIASTRYRQPARAHAHQAPHNPAKPFSHSPFPHRSPPPRHATPAAARPPRSSLLLCPPPSFDLSLIPSVRPHLHRSTPDPVPPPTASCAANLVSIEGQVWTRNPHLRPHAGSHRGLLRFVRGSSARPMPARRRDFLWAPCEYSASRVG
jgi:hypothetical protein